MDSKTIFTCRQRKNKTNLKKFNEQTQKTRDKMCNKNRESL